ncbi:hypothetical protein [uncultured Bacteroides sp.]|uniref:hypothetical protein n=1 Tax=uncultured Bacteroides sp. TaxID=162156 RepID=UPI0023BE76C6|nr:hypothetical protein [uncultured Bacteroides sp.]MDE5702294.1 hypothetical protein [Bacteroides sp.]
MLKTKGYNNHDYNNFYGTLSFKHELPFILKGLSVSGMASYRKYYDFQKTSACPTPLTISTTTTKSQEQK